MLLDRIAERRRHVRIPFYSAVVIRWTDADGEQRRAVGNALNLSTYGMVVDIDTPIPPRAEVLVVVRDFEFEGTARVLWYRRMGVRFRAGLLFQSVLLFYLDVKHAHERLQRRGASLIRTDGVKARR